MTMSEGTEVPQPPQTEGTRTSEIIKGGAIKDSVMKVFEDYDFSRGPGHHQERGLLKLSTRSGYDIKKGIHAADYYSNLRTVHSVTVNGFEIASVTEGATAESEKREGLKRAYRLRGGDNGKAYADFEERNDGERVWFSNGEPDHESHYVRTQGNMTEEETRALAETLDINVTS